ncbi:MAG: hypothetical protein AB8F95_21800 [Bacteroidia bacterium]
MIRSLTMLLFGALLCIQSGYSQTLSDDPALFIQELHKLMGKAGGESARTSSERLRFLWVSPEVTDEEKGAIIRHVNIMLSRKMAPRGTIDRYLLAYTQTREKEWHGTVATDQYLEVSQQCLLNLKEDKIQKYLIDLTSYMQTGILSAKEGYNFKNTWEASQKDATLHFIEIPRKKGKPYMAPVLRFTGTELFFESNRDSTRIYNTAGDYNLVSRAFLGIGGKVTWEKMGLSESDVFAVFQNFKINLNDGRMVMDSVNFFYKSLLDQPIVGRFEDANLGFKNKATARYPYFKSYGGGIVIENIVKDVRYEGGFSLKGIRKVGSAYNVWVDYVPAPMEEGDFIEDEYNEVDVDAATEELYDEFGGDYFEADETYDDDWGDDYETDDTYFEEADEVEEDPYSEDDPYVEEPYEDEIDEALLEKVEKHVLATLQIRRGDEYVMKMEGEEFVLDEIKMVARSLGVTVYLSENDTLYHPAMDLLYDVADRSIVLKKPRSNMLGRMPFTSSYHEFYLYFEAIQWDLDEDDIEFTAFVDKENKVSAIESFSFFKKERFRQFRGVLKFNPVGAVYRYAVENQGSTIFASDITDSYKLPDQLTALERILPLMAGSGFIRYNRKSKEITPLPKLFDWGQFARDKKDYDAIQLTSQVLEGAHAKMNVNDKRLKLQGCQFFSLSDSQHLKVVPIDEQVSVGKGRSLIYAGAMAAGKLNFYGSKENSFTFDYENFSIRCDTLDSLKFVLVRQPPKGYVMTPLQRALRNTVFEKMTGSIYIDAPDNKGGKKKTKHTSEFPVFDSYTGAYVFWDRPEVQSAIYHRDSLYFSLDPFVLDSLDDFDETNLSFEGEFYSAEIFPRFRQSLVVMEDFSLGFKETTPPNGYYVYDNEGIYYDDIVIDGSALWGAGKLEVLDSDVQVLSDSFIFHFDSTMAEIRDFHRDRGFRSGNYYPEVDASKAQFTWYTKEGRVTLRSLDEPIKIFGGEGDFEGEITIREDGMIGNGVMTVGQIRIEDDSILFNEMDFYADDSKFIIIDDDNPEEYHFVAEDVHVDYDIYSHSTTFETKKIGKALAYFPLHHYRTSMSKGTYTKELNELKMEGVSSYVKDNYFISTAPEADSLKFNAKESYYDVTTRSILVSGVPYIYVADATVTPDKLEVTILQSGVIKKLENAIVEADQETKLHRVYEADVNIFSSNDYKGVGKYDYIEINGQKQHILFNNIQVNADTNTYASGEIPESQDFYLTERIRFKGTAWLDASRRFLEFKGEVKIESDNPAFKGAWLEFKRAIVNPDSAYIPIPARLVDIKGRLLTAGLNYQRDKRTFYSNFLQPQKDEADKVVLSVAGGLTFDRTTKEFRIGSQEKLTGKTLKGFTASFNDADNTITTNGLFDFPKSFPKGTLDLMISGKWKEDLRNQKLSTNLMLAIDAPILPEGPYEKVAENMRFLTTSNPDVNFRLPSFQEIASELLDKDNEGDEETRDFVAEVEKEVITSDIKLARRLPVTLLLSNVDFKFSNEYRSLYTDADIGVIGMGGEVVNKEIPGKIVYSFGKVDDEGKRKPDKLEIYLEIDDYNWVFFRFEGEVLHVASSYYDDFIVPLQEEIDKRKKEEGFRFELVSESEVNTFKQEFIKKFIIR